MTCTLFDLDPEWAGDPLNPPIDRPTPAELVARLSRPDRQTRVHALIQQAHQIVTDAVALHQEGRAIVAYCLLWSGGNDSNILAHLMREQATHAVHANTGIGIRQTREHVRESAAALGLPLIERSPLPHDSYEAYVLRYGFPGPAEHDRMYQRLKERQFAQAKKELITQPREQRVVFLAGRRRSESRRRASIPWHERKRTTIWAAPLVNWTRLDLNTYRLMFSGVPSNPVADLLHMSGECLCGSKARRGELDYLRQFYPDVAAEIDDLAARARANGVRPELCVWGWGWDQQVKAEVSRRARLSRLCDDGCQSLFDEEGVI